MRYVKGEDRYQTILFPESIDEYIAPDNPVRIIDAFVDLSVDIQKSGFTYAIPAHTGRPPYDPRDILKLYLYGYMNRIRSSRRLESEAGRNLEVIWLTNKVKPDHKTIANFRKDNPRALKEVFRTFTLLCKEWNLFSQTFIVIDGSKFRAANAKKNNFTKQKINRHLKAIDEKIKNYLLELEANDTAEAAIPEITAEDIKARIKELKQRQETYEKYKVEIAAKGEVSTTDPDARLMAVNNNGVDVCYNLQSAVDSKHCLIIDVDVINNAADQGQLSPMAKQAKAILGVETLAVAADKGYYVAEDLKVCEEEKTITYVAKQTYANSTGEKEYYADQFTYDPEKNVYLCPMGQTLSHFKTRKEKGVVKHFDYRNAEACVQCPKLAKCTTSAKGRTITRHAD
ncbi:MAG TPA: IS1182 family transposase, partial [Candidatus Limnocylindrales bacterium]|nr:IS1182 family transposase [Candidatus Limnocylindrales bacterium]